MDGELPNVTIESYKVSVDTRSSNNGGQVSGSMDKFGWRWHLGDRLWIHFLLWNECEPMPFITVAECTSTNEYSPPLRVSPVFIRDFYRIASPIIHQSSFRTNSILLEIAHDDLEILFEDHNLLPLSEFIHDNLSEFIHNQ